MIADIERADEQFVGMRHVGKERMAGAEVCEFTIALAKFAEYVAGGVVGLLIGAFVIRPPLVHQSRLWLRRAYGTALIVLLVFLTGTVAIDWTGLQVMQQVIYLVLIGLVVFMVIRTFWPSELCGSKPPAGRRNT